MLLIVGALIVMGSVFGGYLMEGGHIEVLVQPIELLIIGGAAAGSLLISSSPALLKQIGKQIAGTLKGTGINKAKYLELLACLFELLKLAKSNPLGIEPHVEDPHQSSIFQKYPGVLHNHHALDFISDTLKVVVSGSINPYDLEDLMNLDIDSAHAEENAAPGTVTRIGDAMPGLGIVAAVLGVVITMGKLTQGKEVIGHSVAAALVGTFLGILASYGFMQPLSAKMASNLEEEGNFLIAIKSSILAYAKGCSPNVCVEFGRRSILPASRPSFKEVDAALQAAKGGEKAA